MKDKWTAYTDRERRQLIRRACPGQENLEARIATCTWPELGSYLQACLQAYDSSTPGTQEYREVRASQQ